MKIAQVVSLDVSVPPKSQNGLEFVVSWITEELVRRGHEVTLFATDDSITSGNLVSLLPQSVYRSEKKQWNVSERCAWNTAYVAARSEEFDIIHSHAGTIARHMPFIKKPVVETLHHPFDQEFWMQDFKDEPYRSQVSFITDAYSKIHFAAVSKNQEEQFSQAEEYFFKKHSVIHNGIPVENFSFSPDPGKYLLYIGYINKNKGAHIAVQVARALGMKLILAGNVYGEDAFFNEFIKPYLNDDIQYVGPVDFKQKNELYMNALATLAPIMWDEPFGLTLVESQACGTPVIAYNRGASSEIIKNGKTGFLVSSEKEMIDAVKNIAMLDRTKCRAWIESNFSVSHMVDQYEALYKTLV